MTTFSLFILAISLSLAMFKLSALALAGFWAAKGAFSPQGLLMPATRLVMTAREPQT